MIDLDYLANELNNSNINGSEEPTKCIKETYELEIKAKIMHIDFEGRSDGESIKKILANLKPKNLVKILILK